MTVFPFLSGSKSSYYLKAGTEHPVLPSEGPSPPCCLNRGALKSTSSNPSCRTTGGLNVIYICLPHGDLHQIVFQIEILGVKKDQSIEYNKSKILVLKNIPQYPGVPHTVFMSTWCSTILESPKSAETRKKFNEVSRFSAFIWWQITFLLFKVKLIYLFVFDVGVDIDRGQSPGTVN